MTVLEKGNAIQFTIIACSDKETMFLHFIMYISENYLLHILTKQIVFVCMMYGNEENNFHNLIMTPYSL